MFDFDFNTASVITQEPMRPPLPAYDAVERFRQAMFDAGLRPDEIADTSGLAMPERCPVADDRPGKKSGWYVFYGDGVSAGAFGNWKTGEEWKWSGKSQFTMTSAEREQFAQKMARAKRVREAQKAENAARARERAERDWERAAEAVTHPYLVRKKVPSFGLKILAGKLLVPMRDAQGTLSSLQEIYADGEKSFLFGGAKQGRFFTIPGTGKVAVCEGYATAASIHMATGWTTVVAFDAGNLLPAAQAWREAHPGDALVICGDDDRWKDKNAGREAAEECARAMNTVALFPAFANPAGKPTDWNDLCCADGVEEARRQLLSGERDTRHFLFRLDTEGPYPTARYTRQTPPELKWAFRDMVLMGSPFVLCGAGGTGKTSMSLQLAASLATGRALLGPAFTPGVRGRTLVLLCEDPEEPIWQRTHRVGQELSAEELDAFDRMVNIQICLGEDMRLVRDDPARGLTTTEAFDALLDAARRMPDLAAVILDPLNLLHGADVERNEEAAQFFCSKLAQLGRESGAAIIVVHHSVKNGTGRGDKFNLEEALHVDTVRGSGAIVAGMRGACNLVVLPPGVAKKRLNLPAMPRPGEYLAGKASKLNYAAQGDMFFLRRGENGVLYPVAPARKEGIAPPADIMPRVCAKVADLAKESRHITRRSFIRVYDSEWGVSRRLLDDAIERALFEGWLELWETANESGRKTVYLVPGENYDPPEERPFDFNPTGA